MTKEKDDNKLWERFAKGNRTYKVVDFPRYDEEQKTIGKVCLRTLLQSEIIQLDLAVAEEVDNLFKSDTKLWNENSTIIVQRYKDRESNVLANHYLQKIIVHADNKEKLVFPTPEHVAKTLSLSEATKLMIDYYSMQEGHPNFSNLSADQFNSWMDLLCKSVKEDQISFLGRLEPEVKIEFTIFLANALSNSNQLNSSLSLQLTKYTETGKVATSPKKA